jgi:hypothetical protein
MHYNFFLQNQSTDHSECVQQHIVTKLFTVQLDFISWQGTFPHKIFSKETSDWKKNEKRRNSPLFLVTFLFFLSSFSFFLFSYQMLVLDCLQNSRDLTPCTFLCS